MDASPASGKRRAGGDQHDRESKRPSAERELPAGREPVTGSSSADGARLAPPGGRRAPGAQWADSDGDEVLDSGVGPLAETEEAMDACLAAAEDSHPLAGVVGMDDPALSVDLR